MSGTFSRTSPKRADQTIYWPIDLGPWLRSIYDTLAPLPGSVVVSNAPDLVESYTVANDLVSLTLSGGLAGTTYRVAVTATSTRGMTRTFIVECSVLGVAPATTSSGGTMTGAQIAAALDGHYGAGGVAEFVRDTVAAFLAQGANVTITHNDAGDVLTIASAGAGGGATLADGNYGDIVVSGSGTVVTIPTNAVAFGDLAGRPTTLSGYGITDAAASGHNHDAAYAAIGHNHNASYEAIGAAAAAVASHAGAADPHPGYLTPTEATAAYAATGHTHVAANVTDLVEFIQDTVAAFLVQGANVTLTYNDAGNTLTIASAGGGGGGTLADGSYGDVTVSGSGTVITVNANAVAFSEIASRPTTLAGYGITDAAAAGHTHAYSTLTGLPTLGTAAALNVPAAGDAAAGEVVRGTDTRLTNSRTPLAHTHPVVQISDATVAGQAMVTAADAAAQRALLNVANGATLNSTDAALRDRATHTGTQLASTISNFGAAVLALAPTVSVEAGTARTLTAADNNTIIYCTSASAVTITVPAAFSGLTCSVVRGGAGAVTIAASGTTINPATLTIDGQYRSASILPTGAANTFVVVGALGDFVEDVQDVVGAMVAAAGGTYNDAAGTVTFPGGGGGAQISGTPTAGQAAEWTNATTVQGVAVTGTGNFVKATSPTLTTPNLGTPSAATLTNATGLPVATGLSGLGAGVAAFMATPSSANLAAAVTGETGSGALVFGTSPTIAAPVVTGIATFSGASILTRTTMPANAIDVTVPNRKSVAANTTFTFSGTPAANTWFDLELTNSSASQVTITIPSSFSVQQQAAITSFNLPANGRVILTWAYDGTTYWLAGEYVAPSGSGTVTSVGITQPAAGITASGGPITASGNITLALANDLAAVEGLSTTGIVRRTAADTWSAGTAVALASEVTGTLPIANGGTGGATAAAARTALGLVPGTDVQTFNARLADIAGITYAQGDILYHNGTALVKLPAGTSGQFLQTGGAAANPVWATPAGGGGGNVSNSGTPTSGQLAEWVTATTIQGVSSSGTGNVVRATSPALTTPNIGTPSAGNLSNCTVDGTELVGFRGIPINSQSAAYTCVLADAGKCIYHPSADTTARTFTIPANASVAYPIGTTIMFDNDAGAGAVTIAITTDTMVLVGAAGSTGSRTLAAGGRATAVKVAATRWRISGTAELT